MIARIWSLWTRKKKKKIPLGGRHSIKDLYLVNYYPPPQFGGGRTSARVWVVGGWVGREVGEAFEVKTRQTVGVPSNQQPETSNLSGSSTHMFRWLAMRRRKENTRMTRKPFFFYDLSIVKISFRLPKSAVSRSATYPGMLPFSVCRWSLYFDQHFFFTSIYGVPHLFRNLPVAQSISSQKMISLKKTNQLKVNLIIFCRSYVPHERFDPIINGHFVLDQRSGFIQFVQQRQCAQLAGQ